ncbi:hypothetical protein VNO77_19942 [Canavalia gladiata]|uniref:Uncharacterized protein n=1 Tax=Canavalia gladiata TaxID=3824 RepID=A0AAN9LNF7_CANGL
MNGRVALRTDALHEAKVLKLNKEGVQWEVFVHWSESQKECSGQKSWLPIDALRSVGDTVSPHGFGIPYPCPMASPTGALHAREHKQESPTPSDQLAQEPLRRYDQIKFH